jgi:hypothetical protein
MDLDLGAWVAIGAALPALCRAYIVTIALRGTQPRERPAILRALPSLLPGSRKSPTCVEHEEDA